MGLSGKKVPFWGNTQKFSTEKMLLCVLDVLVWKLLKKKTSEVSPSSTVFLFTNLFPPDASSAPDASSIVGAPVRAPTIYFSRVVVTFSRKRKEFPLLSRLS